MLRTAPVLSAVEFSAERPQARRVERVDSRFLESLMGYNARRASLAIIERFLREMAVYELRPVDFSVMSLVVHNPGITSSQLCAALGLLPPNLVVMLNALQKRKLIERLPHPHDRRAIGLYPSGAGITLMLSAEKTAARLEGEATAKLTTAEAKTLLRLLRKIYL